MLLTIYMLSKLNCYIVGFPTTIRGVHLVVIDESSESEVLLTRLRCRFPAYDLEPHSRVVTYNKPMTALEVCSWSILTA